jgi:hypothetical protein
MRHDDGGGNLQQPRGQGDGLGMVARGKGHHAGLALRGAEARQGVEGAPELEGAHALQVLALEEDAGAQRLVQRARGEHRSAVGVALDAPGRCGHVVVGGKKACHR